MQKNDIIQLLHSRKNWSKVKSLPKKWIEKYNLNEEDICKLPSILDADPTAGRYTEWLVLQYKKQTCRFPEDTNKLRQYLSLFHKSKHLVSNRNLFEYATPADLALALDHLQSIGQQVVPAHLDGIKRILKDGQFEVVEISTAKALSIISKGTHWCTSDEAIAGLYINKAHKLYLILKDDLKFALLDYDSDQCKDIYDKELDAGAKLDIINMLQPITGVNIYNSPKLALWALRHGDMLKLGTPDISQLQSIVATDASTAVQYCTGYCSRLGALALEHVQSTVLSMSVGGGMRWLEAEEVISKSPREAARYAQVILMRRWPEAEQAIFTDTKAIHNYMSVLSSPVPDLEQHIIQNPQLAYVYCRNVLKKRWLEAEKFIINDINIATLYAKHFRFIWPDLEQSILASIEKSIEAAPTHKLTGTMPSLNELIYGIWSSGTDQNDPIQECSSVGQPLATAGREALTMAVAYANNVRGRWPELEQILIDIIKVEQNRLIPPSMLSSLYMATVQACICNYTISVIKDRWYEIEPLLNSHTLFNYVKDLHSWYGHKSSVKDLAESVITSERPRPAAYSGGDSQLGRSVFK